MVGYICRDCRFRIKEGRSKPNKCPYCNSSNVRPEASAEELVANIETED